MSDTRKGPEGPEELKPEPLHLAAEDDHPPFCMTPKDRQMAARLILNEATNGLLEAEAALRKLVYYGAAEFNALRREFPEVVPCFNGANFPGMVLNGFNFAGADFTGAKIHGTKFVNCDLTKAQLEGAVGTPSQIEWHIQPSPQPSEDAPGAVQKTTRNSGLIDWLNGC